MKTIAKHYNTVIDMRHLILEGTYIRFSDSLARKLCIEFYEYIKALLDRNCVLDWQINKRHNSDIKGVIYGKEFRNSPFTLSMNGNIICEEIYNKSTLRNHNKKIMFPLVADRPMISNSAEDYCEIYDLLLSKENDEDIKKTVLQIFNMSNKIPYGYTIQNDTSAYFSCIPLGDTHEFRGEFTFSISAFCLDDEIDCYANDFAKFIKERLSEYPFLNAHITLDYYDDSYSRYYGRYPIDSNRAYWEDPIGSYLSSVYIMEIGWANYICAESSELGIVAHNHNNRIGIEKTQDGGYWIKGLQQITECDISVLKDIKQSLYNVMLPRINEHGRHKAFRKYWELVPVFDDELSIIDNDVVFCHKGLIDIDYVRDTLNILHL